MMKVPVWVQMWRQDIPSLKTQREKWYAIIQPFCSIKAFTKLKAHPLRERQSALFSLLIQMLISSKNIPHRHTQNNVYPSIWAPCGPVDTLIVIIWLLALSIFLIVPLLSKSVIFLFLFTYPSSLFLVCGYFSTP